MRVYVLRLIWSDLYMGLLKATFFCSLSYGRSGWLKRLTLRSGTGRLWRALCPGLSLMWMWNALPGESTGANPVLSTISSIKASQVCSFRDLFGKLACLRDCLVSLEVYILLSVFICCLCLTPVVVPLLLSWHLFSLVLFYCLWNLNLKSLRWLRPFVNE